MTNTDVKRGKLKYCEQEKAWIILDEDGKTLINDLVDLDLGIKLFDTYYHSCAIAQGLESYIHFGNAVFALKKNFVYDVAYRFWDDDFDKLLLAQL